MSFVMVDIEADGPIPGDYSMICFGAIIIDSAGGRSFKGLLKPISDTFIPEALAISGFTRDETLTFNDPKTVMEDFNRWLKANVRDRPIFISDNNGFDWMFMCWYFHHFMGENPFGHSSVNLGSLYKGLVKDFSKNFKHLRKTIHSHDPVDDARGNAEALVYMRDVMGLRIDI